MRESRSSRWTKAVPGGRSVRTVGILVTAAVGLVAACGDGTTDPQTPDAVNRPPTGSGTVPAQTVQVGETATVDLSDYFSDPDGDALTYAAQTSNGSVATVSVSGSNAAVAGVAKGEATITATATDSGGLSAQQSFAVRVPNRTPEPVGQIANLDLSTGDTTRIDVSDYFSDPDGDALTYGAATSDEGVATTAVEGDTVTVVAVSDGAVSVTVTASDPEGLSAEQSFAATVAILADPSVQFVTVSAVALEGGEILVELEAHPTPDSTLWVGYTIAVDDDPRTNDADEADHDGGSGGTVRFEAGAGQASFEIAVHDDDDIDPTRETLAISLDTPEEGAGYVLGSSSTAMVTIEEGVCDRTPRIRDALVALSGVNECHETDGAHLAAIDTLDLRGPNPEDAAGGFYARSVGGTGNSGCDAEARSGSGGAPASPNATLSRCGFRTPGGMAFRPMIYNRGIASDEPITELLAGDFQELTELAYLGLFDNELTELPAGMFSGLEELRDVRLGGNRLTGLPEDFLSGLSRLEKFSVHDNEITRLPPDLFAGLGRLRELWMAGNELAELPVGLFSDAPNLEELHLWGNRLRALPADIFSELVYLKRLTLGNNRLVELDGAAFSDLIDLEMLGLGNNQLVELPNELFANLGNLDSLWIRQNRLEILQDGLFDGLTNLRYLVADSNRIAVIEEGTFSNLSELQEVWLSDNRLSELRPEMFSGLDGLESLSLNRNRIADVVPGAFAGLAQLEELGLSENPLVELNRDAFAELARLEKLWVTSGELAQVHPGAFNGLSGLTQLSLWENELSDLADGVFAGLSRLEELWIYENAIEELPEEVFAELPRLKKLVMWNNRLTELPPNGFANLSKLKGLYLSGNAITELPPGAFSSIEALDSLSLHHNYLSELSDGLFEGLVDLVYFTAVNNPGAPFDLVVRLERRDTVDLGAPGPANVVLSLAEGAPFLLRIPLSVDGGTLSADTAVIEQGNRASAEFTVTMSSGSQSGTEVVAGPAPPMPDGIFGVEVVAADTLTLFNASGDKASDAERAQAARPGGQTPGPVWPTSSLSATFGRFWPTTRPLAARRTPERLQMLHEVPRHRVLKVRHALPLKPVALVGQHEQVEGLVRADQGFRHPHRLGERRVDVGGSDRD